MTYAKLARWKKEREDPLYFSPF